MPRMEWIIKTKPNILIKLKLWGETNLLHFSLPCSWMGKKKYAAFQRNVCQNAHVMAAPKCLALIVKAYRFRFWAHSSFGHGWNIIFSNDWHSLFFPSSGPEPCENHYEARNQDEGPLVGPKTSRSHLLIKLREVTPGEKRARCLEMSMNTRLFSHFSTNQKYSYCEVRQARSCFLNSIYPQASPKLSSLPTLHLF